MPTTVELEDVSSDVGGAPARRDGSSGEPPAISEAAESETEAYLRGLAHQVDEDDWLI